MASPRTSLTPDAPRRRRLPATPTPPTATTSPPTSTASSKKPAHNNASLWAIDLPNHVVDGDLVVPPGTVFAMGDNRTKSLDGRFWGFVPRENIVGRAHVRLLVVPYPRRPDRQDRLLPTASPSWATSSPTSSPRPAGAEPSTSSASPTVQFHPDEAFHAVFCSQPSIQNSQRRQARAGDRARIPRLHLHRARRRPLRHDLHLPELRDSLRAPWRRRCSSAITSW